MTTHINCPPRFITSYTAFSQQKASTENLACVTDYQLLRITKEKLDSLIQQSPSFRSFSIQIMGK